MDAPESADVEERDGGRVSRSSHSHNTWPIVGLVVLVVLAIAATVVIMLTDSNVGLRVAVGVALWAAVLGALLMMYYQRRASQYTSRNGLIAEDYERALQRELDKRDAAEQKRREELEEASREEVEQLREELSELRISLAQFFDPDFDDQLAISDGQGYYYYPGNSYGYSSDTDYSDADDLGSDYSSSAYAEASPDYGDSDYDFATQGYAYTYTEDDTPEAHVVHDAQVVFETRHPGESTTGNTVGAGDDTLSSIVVPSFFMDHIDNSTEDSAEDSSEKPAEKPVEKPVEKPAEKQAKKSATIDWDAFSSGQSTHKSSHSSYSPKRAHDGAATVSPASSASSASSTASASTGRHGSHGTRTTDNASASAHTEKAYAEREGGHHAAHSHDQEQSGAHTNGLSLADIMKRLERDA